MKNFYWLMGGIFCSVYAQAAMVTLGTPGGSQTSYGVDGQTYSVFANISSGAGFGSNADDEELIWLGAHESWAGDGPTATQVTDAVVNVNNQTTGKTKGVSLVLSSVVSEMYWEVNIADKVQLNNIFIIALGSDAHTVRVNRLQSNPPSSAQSSFAPGAHNPMLNGVNVLRSNTTTDCGYELPTTIPVQGCNTEVTLGLAMNAEFDFQNVLANMQVANGTNLELTSFSGSYYVNQFDVSIDSVATVIPLPASGILLGSALLALSGLRKYVGAAPPITT